MHGGDNNYMCCQRRPNLSPATHCAGVTKCAITDALHTNAFMSMYLSYIVNITSDIMQCFVLCLGYLTAILVLYSKVK